MNVIVHLLHLDGILRNCGYSEESKKV